MNHARVIISSLFDLSTVTLCKKKPLNNISELTAEKRKGQRNTKTCFKMLFKDFIQKKKFRENFYPLQNSREEDRYEIFSRKSIFSGANSSVNIS